MIYFTLKLSRNEPKNGKKTKWIKCKYDGQTISFFNLYKKQWGKPLTMQKAFKKINNIASKILKFSSGSDEYKLTPDESIETVGQLIDFLTKSESESESDFGGNDECLYAIPVNP
jgi:hypothetical protein